MNAFYFGPPDIPLFGCHHVPASPVNRSAGVVLCYPVGHEYSNCHRSYQQLAVRLAAAGFHALRFDFSGTGDSGGVDEEGDLSRWETDVSTSVDELRRRAGVGPICLVGLRLGASLAMLTAAHRGDIDGLILWEPVMNGRAYLDGLREWHAQFMRHYSWRWDAGSGGTSNETEVLAMSRSDQSRAALAGLDLLTVRERPARNVLVITGGGDVELTELTGNLERRGATVEWQTLPTDQIWHQGPEVGLVPSEVLQRMIVWLARTYA